MMEKKETKDFKLEIKELTEEGEFEGYAAIFDIMDSYNDVIEKGAFKKSLEEKPKIKILWQHSTLEPIGIAEGKEDDKGLKIKGQLVLESSKAREIYYLMKKGIVDGLSIGYKAVKEIFEGSIRRLKEIKLMEVSLVMFPANEYATVTNVKEEDLEKKPYENYHACRINPPEKYDKFRYAQNERESDGKKYDVIYGKIKGKSRWEEQAYRYSKEIWTASEAKEHCEDHDGKFEEAKKDIDNENISDKMKSETLVAPLRNESDNKPPKEPDVLSAKPLLEIKREIEKLKSKMEEKL